MQQQLRIFKKHLRLAFVVPLLLAFALGGVFVLQTYYLRSSMQAVDHSYQVQIWSRSFLKLFLDMETSLRGYLLTGQKSFLQPYQNSAPEVQPALVRLRDLTASDPQQQQLVTEMERLYFDWHAYANAIIRIREAGEPISNVTLNQGNLIMDEVRARRDKLLQIEQGRSQRQTALVRRTLTGIFATAVFLSLAFGLLIATFARHEMETVARTFSSALETSYRRTDELHQNQRWLSAVLSSIADAVIATDLQGKLLFSNAVARQIFAMSEDPIPTTHVGDLMQVVDEYTREPIPDPFEKVMRTERPYTSTGRLLLLRDDLEIPVSLLASPIRNDEAAITGAVIVIRDLTEQRQSERSLQSAEKLASIGRLATTVAHEIHNPLDALGNLLYLVGQSNTLSDSNRTYLQLAREELERVTDISEQMLTFSRDTRQPVPVNLSNVLDNVLTLYAARIQRMGVEVTRRFEMPGTIVAFPGEMRQIFSNLIGNALDAMNRGGRLTLHIEGSRLWANGHTAGIRVVVCDNGSGVPDELRGKLMDPFVTSKGEKGTGLGLWVCRGIVEKYRGRLDYRTCRRPGHSGTCFSVFFPVAQREVPHDLLATQRAS